MTAIRKTIHRYENKFNCCAERFAFRHPCLRFLTMFFCVPLLTLLAVAACTLPLAALLSLLLGGF